MNKETSPCPASLARLTKDQREGKTSELHNIKLPLDIFLYVRQINTEIKWQNNQNLGIATSVMIYLFCRDTLVTLVHLGA